MYTHFFGDTVDRLKDINAADGLKDIWRVAHATGCTTYGKTEQRELQSDVPPAELREFLSNEAVSNSDAFQLKDLVLIDKGRILCCWPSVPGSTSKRLKLDAASANLEAAQAMTACSLQGGIRNLQADSPKCLSPVTSCT